MQKYAEGTFTENIGNLGVDFKKVTLKGDGDREVTLKIWDTTGKVKSEFEFACLSLIEGEERWHTNSSARLVGAAGVLLVFDITGLKTQNHAHTRTHIHL